MKIILGSSSIFRRKVLEKAGIEFEVIAPDIDEKNIRTVENEHTPIVISYAKVMAVAEKVTEPAIIIACDQVILCDGLLLEKPESADEVREWFKLYPKHPVHYVNGITVLNTVTKSCLTGLEISITTFKEIPEDFMEEQITKGDIFKSCGGIGDDVHGIYATVVSGSRDSIAGFPLEFIMNMVEKVKS